MSPAAPSAAPQQAARRGPVVGERYEVERRAGRARRPLRRRRRRRRASSSSSGTRCPGERVVVEVTEGSEGDRFWRGDAVEVLEASPRPGRRRRARTPGPARCGGCDFQHVDARRRSAPSRRPWSPSSCAGWPGSTWTSWSRRCPATTTACGWRTRMQYVAPARRRPRAAQAPLPRGGAGRRLPDRRARRREPAPGPSTTSVRDARPSPSTADGFWQVALGGAARCWSRRARGCSRPQPGERSLDLYAGVGLFAAFLADAVGPAGRVVAVEGDRARRRARARTTCRPRRPRSRRGRVDRVLRRRTTSRSTSSSSTRRARAPSARGRRADRRPRAAGGRLRRLRPGRAGPRRRDLRRARLRAARRCAPSTCSR